MSFLIAFATFLDFLADYGADDCRWAKQRLSVYDRDEPRDEVYTVKCMWMLMI